MTPDLNYAATLGGASAVTALIVEVIVRALGANFNVDRFGPVLALIVGVIVTVLATAALGLGTSLTYGNAVITGLFAGASAMGIHDIASGTVAGGGGDTDT